MGQGVGGGMGHGAVHFRSSRRPTVAIRRVMSLLLSVLCFLFAEIVIVISLTVEPCTESAAGSGPFARIGRPALSRGLVEVADCRSD